MPRSYYLAVDPPPVDRARLSLVMRRLGNPSPLPHITIVEPPRLSPDLSWWELVVGVGAASAPVEIETEGVRTFDDRVIYLALNSPSLADLRCRLLDVITSDAGEQSSADERRTFVPHLTLAVARRGRPLPHSEKVEPLVAHLAPFRASELTLYRRDIAAHGYRAWRHVALDGS
ncbi:MAG TPA: 2'-5' RNA ligase family protein [Acidimicrobiales bacterium]